jgi:hypothetical protein
MSNLSIGSPAQSPWPLINRLLAAFIMGLVLLVLSALVHTAAGATVGGGWSYLWVTWLIAGLIVIVAAVSAPAARTAWARLCVVNGLASTAAGVFLLALPLNEAALREMAERASWPYATRPLGAALGAALASGALGLAAVVIAIIFFTCAYFFRHPRPRSHLRA